MTPEERQNEIEQILARMQVKIDELSASLEEVYLKLEEALKRIEAMEEREAFRQRTNAMIVFKGRLN